MLHKRLFIYLIPLLLLLVGCFESGSNTGGDVKEITFDGISSSIDSIKSGDEVQVFFAFTATEYLTAEDVNIIITNSVGVNMEDYFTINVPNFTEKKATLVDKKCSFIISSDDSLDDDTYKVTIDLILGGEKATKVYYIQIGKANPVKIESIDDLSVKVGKVGADTIYAKIKNGPHLTKGNFVVAFMDTNGTQPDVSILSYENDSLAMSITTMGVVSGEYTGILGIPIEGVSDSFTVTVSDVQLAQIKTVNNIALKSGAIDSTIATVQYGNGLHTTDFKIIVTSSGSSSFTPVAPEVVVSSYEEGVATIAVDADGADLGTYIATLSVENSSKSFTITVTEEGNTIEITEINNVSVFQEFSSTTTAIISNGSSLTVDDFAISVTGSGSGTITPVPPAAIVQSYKNGIVSITIDATNADAGSYYGTLTVGKQYKNFKITVEALTSPKLDLYPLVLQMYNGSEGSFSLSYESPLPLTEDNIDFIIPEEVENFMSFSLSPFNAKNAIVKANVSTDKACPIGKCSVYIKASLTEDCFSIIPLTIQVLDSNPVVISMSDVSIYSGTSKVFTADIKNGDTLSFSDFSITVDDDNVDGFEEYPITATPKSYVDGTLEIEVTAPQEASGQYTRILKVGRIEKSFVVTVHPAVLLTEKSMKLYNPYAKDGYNSAYNIVNEVPVAGEVQSDGKMKYAVADSLVADLAVDNSADIRETNIVAEVTSINGGMFAKIAKSEYEEATTDLAVKYLSITKVFTDNEVIITALDDIDEDGYFLMKMANDRGYAVVKITEINTTDSEGSGSNTGYLRFSYRYLRL